MGYRAFNEREGVLEHKEFRVGRQSFSSVATSSGFPGGKGIEAIPGEKNLRQYLFGGKKKR